MQTTSNIKVPYPTEGIIRTAQLDDTVTPENSVQLAVNMNFDRIGAIQTRPGVTNYATQVANAIKNYGTLHNFTFPDGYDSILQVGAEGEFSPMDVQNITAVKVNDTHILTAWTGTDGDGFAQIMEVNMDDGGVTPLGSALEFDTADGKVPRLLQVDSTHFLLVWVGPANDGFSMILAVNTGSWAVTAAASSFEYDAANGEDPSVAQIDSNHFIVFYTGASQAGKAIVLEVNLGTWAITAPGSALTFEAVFNINNACAALGDGTHFINFWSSGSGGLAQMFEVNTGTWAITDLDSPFTMDPTGIDDMSVVLVDANHFIAFWQGFKAGGLQGIAQVFEVNLSTFAITEPDTYITYSTASGLGNSAVDMGDGEHFTNIWMGAGSLAYMGMFVVDPLTYEITQTLEPAPLGDSDATKFATVKMDSYHVYGFWKNGDTTGVGAAFKMQGEPEEGRWLYAGFDDVIQNWDGAVWTTRRSSLSEVSKPRFSQFLNRIWMVNGNSTIGGDPVMTSDGGAFDSTLVPDDFPAGDFIHAGFEGRVWVADKTYGIIYYTDIVQFTPPDVFSLTFDPEVNFISNISPQDGQTITALFRVPRALLVFTEDNIFRIYGATSIDAYPAYDVGTYSQESIIETKTGIFFHHSSGFYQFDYGSQPVEISRRVIDFVKAIPRSQYDDIVGVYDGFDAVEWAVGTVTVEGVTFDNCVMRYTISTQVWTIYDYVGNVITAMISYDDGTTLNHLMGTSIGKTGAMDVGLTDFSAPFYYEYIDRWRSYSDVYALVKNISGINVYSENAAGANFMYQKQKAGANVWEPLGTVDQNNNSLFPNANTEDFDVIRFRLAGTTKGTPVVVHGIEILSLTIKGYDQN